MREHGSKRVNSWVVFVVFAMLILITASTSSATGTTYYVDGINGNDATGTGTLTNPFKSIGHVVNNYNYLLAGDTVSIKAGTYREWINPKRDGTAGNPVTIKAYGDGPVIIDNSPVLGTWTVSSGNIWVTTPPAPISNVVVSDVPLLPASVQWNAVSPWHNTDSYNASKMHEGYFFYDWNSNLLYVWLPGGANPNTADLHVVKWGGNANADNGIYMWNTSYNVFDGLTIQYSTWYGINWQGDTGTGHNTYKNCVVKFSGNTGIAGGPNALIQNNDVSYSVMLNWPRGRWNGGAGGWGSGITANTGSTFEGNTIHNNGGEGLLSYLANNMTYRGNRIYDNWSVNLYIDNDQNVLVENNLIYCNDPDYTVTTNAGCQGLNCVKRVRGQGIMTADEYYDGLSRLQDVTIRNNIVTGCRRGYWHSADVGTSGMKNVSIVNNTFVTPSSSVSGDFTANAGSGDNYFAVGINDSYGNNTGSVVKNNIIVARNAANYALWAQTGADDLFSKITFQNNLIYNSANAKPIHWGPDYSTTYDYTLAQWRGLTGATHAIGDISSDPLFANIGGTTAASYLIDTLSPAKGAGTTTSSNLDYNNFAWISPASVGALEYGSVFDITAPIVSLTAPANKATVSGTLSVTADASANGAVSRVEFYLDGALQSTDTTTPYSYSWDTKAVSNGVHTLSVKAYDLVGNMGQSTNVTVNVSNDSVQPTISGFTIPLTSTSLTVPITSLTATDNVGVAGYLLTQSATTIPAASDAGWTATAPTSFTFSSAGVKSLYAWAKDAAGNISNGIGRSITITLPDTTKPIVSAFTMAATAATLSVPVSTLTATDNTRVTGYLITESSTAPAANAVGWSSTVPVVFTFSGAGTKTAYAWAKDAAGNISAGRSTSVTITLPDTMKPIVSAFTMAATAATLNVPVSSLTATDNIGVTGYLITESSTAPLSTATGWSSSAPTSYTAATAGSHTLYAWAKDAAGNVSTALSATVNITLAPVQTTSTIWPATSVPATVDSGPDSAVQLGVKFKSDVSGYITGIRFYKAPGNIGTHVGSLWTTGGQRLARATFTNETGSGWQQVNFSTPVAISANTVYIASYHTTVGHYSENIDYFTGKGVDNPPLHALANGTSGPNSVYAYGSSYSFPNQTWRGVNYWVDVVFRK